MGEITAILSQWASSDDVQKNRVFEALYGELRQIAGYQMQQERQPELQPTALVHEAYMRLVELDRINLNGRSHFLRLASRVMRQILVDEARRQSAQKRDNALVTRLTGSGWAAPTELDHLLELDEVLQMLAEEDPEFLQLVELRLFAGLSIKDTAEVIGISESSLKRKWKVAQAWIKERLETNAL